MVEHVSKDYRGRRVVSDLSFSVRPGVVTGFLGPNGAGKSTTMRLLLGLERPSAGEIRIHGRRLSEYRFPLREVGALLDAKAVHPTRSARSHLVALALSNAIPRRRVDEVLEVTGLTSAATKKCGSFSLGMAQRLGLATALLGDPGVLLLDEPINGLDPEGIAWIRALLRRLASEGRTVLVSSHVMSEMAQTASDLVVIGRGKLLAATSVADFLARGRTNVLRVASDNDAALAAALRRAGATVSNYDPGLRVEGLSASQVGRLARDCGWALSELMHEQSSLEDVFLKLTAASVEYQGRADT